MFALGVERGKMAVNGLYHEPVIKEEMQGMATVWGYPSQTIRNNPSALLIPSGFRIWIRIRIGSVPIIGVLGSVSALKMLNGIQVL